MRLSYLFFFGKKYGFKSREIYYFYCWKRDGIQNPEVFVMSDPR